MNGIHECAAIRITSKYLNKPTKDTLKSRLTQKGPQASGRLNTYWKVINKLLRAYVPDYVVVAGEFEVTQCVLGEGMTEVGLYKVLWKKAPRCGSVFSEFKLI